MKRLKISKDYDYYALDSHSKIDTSDPMKNEFVSGWGEKPWNPGYLLLANKKRWAILSGFGADDAKKGSLIKVIPDGNDWKNRNRLMGGFKVIQLAATPEEIKKFKPGKYDLFVMK